MSNTKYTLINAERAVSEQMIRLACLRADRRKLGKDALRLAVDISETEDRLGYARVQLNEATATAWHSKAF